MKTLITDLTIFALNTP